MGIPLATEMSTETSRKREVEPMPGEPGPAAARPRLENIENMNEKGFEFDVCELFSPPRVCKLAAEAGWRAGYSLDKECADEVTGKSWDFTQTREQAQLWGLLRRRPTRLLVASPPCTTFSSLQHLRKTIMPDKERREGQEMLAVAAKACMMQVKNGGQFIFEHPAGASSWQEPCMKALGALPGVQCMIIDQCMYGLKSQDREGIAPAKKTTRIMTNLGGRREIPLHAL